MHVRYVVLAVLAAAVTLTSVAAAGPEAAKQRVAIDAKILPQGAFVLTPFKDGGRRDGGTFTGNWRSASWRDVIRDGQTVSIYTPVVWTLTGKRGTLTIRERTEWVGLENDANRDGQQDGIALGTWKVVRGTGEYAGITGSGRSAHEGLGHVWFARYEGFLKAP